MFLIITEIYLFLFRTHVIYQYTGTLYFAISNRNPSSGQLAIREIIFSSSIVFAVILIRRFLSLYSIDQSKREK